jgi:hypothetical protein
VEKSAFVNCPSLSVIWIPPSLIEVLCKASSANMVQFCRCCRTDSAQSIVPKTTRDE